jgi:phage gpG-like protein
VDAVAQLAELARRLLTVPAMLPDLMRQLGEECVDLIKAEHDAGEDPYGTKWVEKADGTDSHLASSGNLKSGWHITQADAGSVTVAPTAFYASVHQGGKTIRAKTAKGLRFKVGGHWVRRNSVYIPARPMVPDNRGLPDEWRDSLKETAEKAIEVLLGK